MEKHEKLDRVLDKMDKLDERMDGMSVTLIRNTESLEHHIARTNLLEDYVKKEITPIKKHIDIVKYGFQGVAWVAVVLGGVAGFLLTLRELGLF